MAELHPELAKAKAQTARQFLVGFNGEDFGILREDTPGPHDRRHLAIALDYVEELTAMVLNLADRVTPTYGPDNPPRLRKPGESIEEYRAAMGWSNKTPNIVERLRGSTHQIDHDAADEIERLRERLAVAFATCTQLEALACDFTVTRHPSGSEDFHCGCQQMMIRLKPTTFERA